MELQEQLPVDGFWFLCLLTIIFTLAWLCLFYLLRWLQPWWLSRWPKLVDDDFDPNWCTRNVLGIIHGTLVAGISVPVLVVLFAAPVEAKFGAAGHLADCSFEQSQSDIFEWDLAMRSVALAGLGFTSFTLADLFISSVHKLATWDHWLHHSAYVTAGLIIRFHCMLPFNAAILMAMEASTPFLNYTVLLRKQSPSLDHNATISGHLFTWAFFLFRIVLNTYGAALLCFNYDLAMPSWVPAWQYWLLVIAIIGGAVIQCTWLRVVLRTANMIKGNATTNRKM